MHPFIEAEFAQAPGLRNGEAIPGDGGDRRGPAHGKRFERKGGRSEHAAYINVLRTIINCLIFRGFAGPVQTTG